VRGKAGKPVEFGSKISVSMMGKLAFVDHLSWDAFNESADLIAQVKAYKERFGFYPESVYADGIYGTRDNRTRYQICRQAAWQAQEGDCRQQRRDQPDQAAAARG